MSNTILAQYKAKFSKALDFIVEDLRLSEDEVQELLTWMTRNTRSRIFRPVSYNDAVTHKETSDSNSFEAVFIPELDELNTKSRPKEKKNEISKPAAPNIKPKPAQGTSKGKPEASVVRSGTTGGTKPTGSPKPPVPKSVRINTAKAQVTSKTTKAPIKASTTTLATKANAVKQVSTRPSIKPIKAAPISSKPKN
jgi:hypothetical protein